MLMGASVPWAGRGMWMTEESDKINSDKIEDERREKRHGLIKRAKIVVGNSVIDCAVVNVSTSGARVRTGAVVVVPEHVVLRFSGGSAFVAQHRWSRGMEMGFVLNGPAPLTEHAALLALSAFPAYQPISPLCVDGPAGESGGACGGAAERADHAGHVAPMIGCPAEGPRGSRADAWARTACM